MTDSDNEELKGTNECKLNIDCRRFRIAKACYDTFYSSLQEGKPAKTNLDECKDAAIATACANVSK